MPSDNFLAETLLKALGVRFGGAGSTRAGAQVVRSSVVGLGLAPTVVDGSGLSRANHTSPRQVVRLLQRMGEEDTFPAFQRSLAVAGVSGTLRRRMRGTPAQRRCRGKTGTLTRRLRAGRLLHDDERQPRRLRVSHEPRERDRGAPPAGPDDRRARPLRARRGRRRAARPLTPRPAPRNLRG